MNALIIQFLPIPEDINNPKPFERQQPAGLEMPFAFLPFSIIKRPGPGAPLHGAVGKPGKDIPEIFVAGKPEYGSALFS